VFDDIEFGVAPIGRFEIVAADGKRATFEQYFRANEFKWHGGFPF
jgi:hypothetical protein